VLTDTVFHTLAYKVTEYDDDINFWAMDEDTNYYVTFHSTAGMIAINLMGIEPDAQKLAEHCAERIYRSMDAFAEENGWREGLTYLDFCWGQSACYFLLALERNTDLKPYDHPWFKASVEWALWGSTPDRQTIACFGDNEPENYSVGSYLARVNALTELNYLLNDEIVSDVTFFQAACIDRKLTDPGFDVDEFDRKKSLYIPGLEWGFARSPLTDENDFYLALKSGVSGYDHNHLDQGSFILAAFSEILISDPGRGGPDVIRKDPYTNCLYEAGLGHNTLIVGDGCYMDLELFPDNPKYFAEPGKITSYEDNGKYVLFTTDNSGLYPTEPLLKFYRTFIYFRPGEFGDDELGKLVIADHVEFSEPIEHSILFHFPGEVELSDTGHARLLNKDARLDYSGFCSVQTVDKTERQESDMQERDSTCYYRSTDGAKKLSDWFHVLIPVRKDAPDTSRPAFASGGGRIVIILDGNELLLVPDEKLGWIVSDGAS